MGEVVYTSSDFTEYMSSALNGVDFEQQEDAFVWAQSRANERLFNIIRSSKRKRSDGSYHHYFACECTERAESSEAAKKKNRKRKCIFSTMVEKGQRVTASKRVGCRFRGVIRKEADGRYHVQVFEGHHNHQLTYYVQGNVAYTRLTDEDKQKIREMWFAHCAPKAIVKALQFSEDVKHVLKRAVYNYTSSLKKEAAAGRNPAMQFLQLARERDYFTRCVVEPGTNKLKDMFWSHPNGRQMLRVYSTVFCVDSTYSTNKYGYALIEFIGVSPTNQNFTAAQALLQHEDKHSYMWAMRCFAEILGDLQPQAIVTDRELGLFVPIATVFPQSHHMLCMFHVKKMIRARAVKALRSGKDADRMCNGAVRMLLHSPTYDKYLENEAKLRQKYGWVRGFMRYMDDTWLVHKEKIVLAWTNGVRHFGNTTTNRVESAHSALKGWMSSCRGGLDTLFEKTHVEVESQIDEIKCRLGWSQSKNLIGYSVSPFAHLLRRVSHHCLDVLKKECTKMGNCTHALRTTHGLPCRCDMDELRLKGQFIEPEMVDVFWTTLAYDGEAVDVPHPMDLTQMIEELGERDPADQRRCIEFFQAEMHLEEGEYEEPVIKVNKKGRPSKKKGKITRHLSGWEHTDKMFSSSQTTEALMRSKEDEELDKVGGKDVPVFVREYLVGIEDVETDGNCGFRCVALRFLKSPDSYLLVRQLLISEINGHKKIYAKVYDRVDGGLKAANRRLEWRGKKCPASHWMRTPLDLFAIAQVFKAIATVYSNNDCTTVLPWRGSIEDYDDLPEISLILRRGRLHFVLGHFCVDDAYVADNPLPRMHPTWFQIRDTSLSAWEDVYAERMKRFQYLQELHRDHSKEDPTASTIFIDP